MDQAAVPKYIRAYFLLIAAITLGLGCFLIVWPEVITTFYPDRSPQALFFIRILGSTLLGYAALNGLTSYFSHNYQMYKVNAWANAVTLSIATILCIVFSNSINNSWLLIAQHAVFAFGFIICIIKLK